MKLLIDIPDGYKDRYKSATNGTIAAKILLNCIANGTVLSDENCVEYYMIYDDKTLSCGGGGYESLEEARATIKEFRELSKEFEEFKDFCTPESAIAHVIEVKEIVEVNDEVDDVGKLIVKSPPVKQDINVDISGDQPARPAICWWVESNYNGYNECGVCGCEFTSKSSNYCPRCGVEFTEHKRK